MKKITLVNITGQCLIVGFKQGKKKDSPMEPIVLKGHERKPFDSDIANEILQKCTNVRKESSLTKPKKHVK